jgi:lipoyl(octanoyl) transferase
MINARLSLAPLAPASKEAVPVEWEIGSGPVGYLEAVARMDARVAAIAAGQAPELVWFLEHPPLFTAGTGARNEDLSGTARFPVHATGRGGRLTYHGPGQRVGYVMLNLRSRGADVRRYVLALEEWIIRALASLDVKGERRADRIGVWVARPDKGNGFEDKIAALGIRVKRWVTLHGISLNIAPDLSHYAGILPCGVREQKWGVTSLADLGIKATTADVDAALQTSFAEIFGPVRVYDIARERA